MMASAKRVSREAFDDLCKQIQYWNENRLELFEISMPNEVHYCYLTQVLFITPLPLFGQLLFDLTSFLHCLSLCMCMGGCWTVVSHWLEITGSVQIMH